jgi:hypothetical protein
MVKQVLTCDRHDCGKEFQFGNGGFAVELVKAPNSIQMNIMPVFSEMLYADSILHVCGKQCLINLVSEAVDHIERDK